MKKALKRSLSFLLAITIIFGSAYVGLSEVDFNGFFVVQAKAASSGKLNQNISWTLSDDGILTISGSGDMPDYSDPSMRSPFISSTQIKKIVIENNITSIGGSVFSYCENLISVEIPETVTHIYGSAFYCCTSLTSVLIPSSVTFIASGAFLNCTALSSIDFSGNVNNLSKRSFVDTAYYNNESNWDDGVLYIGNHLVEARTTLSSEYEIKQGTKVIASHAFENCENLTAIKVPDSLVAIGTGAFDGCLNLDAVYITDVAAWCNIGLYSTCNYYCSCDRDFLLDGANELYINGEPAIDVVIPEGVTEIPAFAFSCNTIKSVTIPESVTSIKRAAFYNCTSLENVYISDVESWCNIDFEFDDTVWYIGYYANPLFYAENLYVDGKLTVNVVIPETVTTIPAYGFSCENIATVVVPDNVKSIGEGAFRGCKNLVSIDIGDGVTSIDDATFSGCTSLVNVTIGDGVESIGENAFYNCVSLDSITLPNSVEFLDYYAFYGCSTLSSITISEKLKNIGGSAFYYCSDLRNVYITDIAAWCSIDFEDEISNPLYWAEYLYIDGELASNIEIPDGVVALKDDVFNCINIKSISIPATVTTISDYALRGCCYLKDISVSGENDNFTSLDGVLYNKEKTTLIKYPENKADTDYNIPDTVINFSDNAIEKAKFETIVLGRGIVGIKSSSFYNCQNLKNVIIPSNIVAIGSSAFEECENIDEIYYEGLQEDWDNVTISTGNSYLTNARFHYNVDIAVWQDHYGEPDSVTPATCTTDGSQTFTCPCGYGKTETIPALGHSYSNEWIVTEEATCTAEGYRYKGCANCSNREEEIIPALGHKGEWEINKEPICDETGSKSCYCENCLQDVTVVIPATGHSFVDGFCSVCGGEYLPESVHPYVNNTNETWVINRDGALNIAVTFSEDTQTESDYDYIYIYDANNNQIGEYCGSQLSGKTIVISGDTVKIRLTSDGSQTYYGFKVTEIQCLDTVFTYSVSSDGATITGYLGTESSIVIPAEVGGYPVVAIGEEAFYNNTSIIDVDLPDTIQRVGRNAFYGTALYNDRVNWINGILYVDGCLIDANNTALNYNTWNIKDGTTVIADSAMENFVTYEGQPVTTVILPDSLKFAGDYSFICSNISYVFYLGTQEQWDEISISSDCGLAHFPVHCGTLEHTCEWKETLTPTVSSEGLKENVCVVCGYVNETEALPMLTGFEFVATDVSSYKLASYNGIAENVIIPSTHNNCQVTAIDTGCFKGNTTINKVVIPVGVESIGALAFMNCTNLQVVSIPATVTSIGTQAFYKFTGTIYCQCDSYAHKYAIENGIDYIIPTLEAADENTIIDFENMRIISTKANCNSVESIVNTPSTMVSIGVASHKTLAGDFYGTGSTITVFDGNNYMGDYTLVVSGDTNGDSVCDALDAWQVSLASNGHKTLDGAYAIAADSNGDEEIDIFDYQSIVNKAVS